jgi:histidinol dehydrogenase
VLPTSRAARFSSGLSTTDFLKRTSILKCDPAAFAALAPSAVALADAEGLSAHARSMRLRSNRRH